MRAAAVLAAFLVAVSATSSVAQTRRDTCTPRDLSGCAIQPSESDRRSTGSINTLREMFAELGVCWKPPAGDRYRPGMEVTVRMSFRANGTLMGEPRFTYFSAWAPPHVRQDYRESVLKGLAGCVPLRFTPGMGGAIAGRTILFRYIDNRNTQRI